MSGHSKWAQIKRQKSATDTKRGLAFTKLSNAIAIAVRQGGGIGDPTQNFRLRLAVEAARAANMPKDNIERAIQRVLAKQEGGVDEVVYEGFTPGGVSVIVEAITDNKNRTSSEIKNFFEKNGGVLGQPGSVSYQFKQIGQIIIVKDGKSMDDIFIDSVESGAEDVEDIGEEVIIYTTYTQLAEVRNFFDKKGYIIKEIEIIRKPVNVNELKEGEEASKIINFLEKLEELDDVQKVFSNFELIQ